MRGVERGEISIRFRRPMIGKRIIIIILKGELEGGRGGGGGGGGGPSVPRVRGKYYKMYVSFLAEIGRAHV